MGHCTGQRAWRQQGKTEQSLRTTAVSCDTVCCRQKASVTLVQTELSKQPLAELP